MNNIIYKMGIALGLIILFYLISTIIKTSSGTSWITSLTAPIVNSESYQLETEGYNMRLYSFIHPKDKKKECMVVASSDGAGVTCWDR